MQRKLCVLVAAVFVCVVPLSYVALAVSPYLFTYSLSLQRFLVRGHLRRKHEFWAAADKRIQLVGRWAQAANKLSEEASLPGSRVCFRFTNATSFFVSLTNISDRRARDAGNLVEQNFQPVRLESPSQASYSYSIGPTSLLVTLNRTVYVFRENAYGILHIAKDLDVDQLYQVDIELLGTSFNSPNALGFEGLWLSKGARIIALTDEAETKPSSTSTAIREGLPPIRDSCGASYKVLEIIGPASTVSSDSVSCSGNVTTCHIQYPRVLAQSLSTDLTVATFPVPSNVCLTSKCRAAHRPSRSLPTISDVYFRSGSVDTPLFHTPWLWSSKQRPPSLLLLDIGLIDFHTFLAAPRAEESQSALRAFTSEFVRSYANLIVTIRRNMWQRNLESSRACSFAYTSAPSTLPVLLLVPPLPPTYHPIVVAALHDALNRVVAEVQSLEGDKMTSLVDTSGWLEEEDFDTNRHDMTSDTASRHGLWQDLDPGASAPPLPNASGHKKLAYLISLHICPHLCSGSATAADTSYLCPFDHYSQYTGHLFEPDQVQLGRLMEETKLKRIKELVGRF